jgi:DNA (cytosine-5)-methyltransferase 1
VYAHDICPHAEAVYNANHRVALTKSDILDLDVTEIPDHDLLCAGFPCQPFSRQGAMLGEADPRYRVWTKLVQVLKYHRPRALLFENVPLLLRHSEGEAWRKMRLELDALGYYVQTYELNTAVFSTVPQGRTRVYIVGLCKLRTPFTTFEAPPVVHRIRPVTDFLQENVHPKYHYNNQSNPIHRELMEHVTDPNTVYTYRSRESDPERRVRPNKRNLCPTIVTNGGGYHTPIVVHKGVVRKLTPRECFNLQGFPTDYVLPDTMSDSNLYTLAGNAVSYPIVQAIGTGLWDVLVRA